MKAIIWKNEDLGAKFDIVDIPADLKEKSDKYRKELVEAAVEEDENIKDGGLLVTEDTHTSYLKEYNSSVKQNLNNLKKELTN